LLEKPIQAVGPDQESSLFVDPLVYDIPTYCRVHKKSRSALYNDWARGEGPDYYKEGTSIRITGEAARRHRAKLEERARAEREKAAQAA